MISPLLRVSSTLLLLQFSGLSQLVLGIESTKISSLVLELNDRFLEVKTEGLWFVEFYAPWCGHCKRLHPIWESVANALSDTQVRVGKIDCTRFTDVASKLNIRGYPTIKFFRDGNELEYDGDRTKEALVDFALKVVGPKVRQIESAVEFHKIHSQHKRSAFFLHVISPSLEAREVQEAQKLQFDESADQLFTKSFFYRISADQLPTNISVAKVPSIVVIKDKSIRSYADGEETDSVESWANRERWTLMPELTYGILYDIGNCCNRLLVMGVLDMVEKSKKNSPVRKFGELLEQTATRHYDKLHRDFQFVWLDGPEIARSIILGAVEIPSLLVFNTSSYQFYLPQDATAAMTEDSIFLFLQSVIEGKVQAHGGKSVVQKFRRAFFEFYSAISGMFYNQPLLATCLFGLPLGILSVICYSLCSADNTVDTEEIYRDSDESDEDHDKTE